MSAGEVFSERGGFGAFFSPNTCYTQIVEITAEAVRFQHVNGNEDLVADIASKNLKNCT